MDPHPTPRTQYHTAHAFLVALSGPLTCWCPACLLSHGPRRPPSRSLTTPTLCSKYGVKGYPTIKYFTDSTDPMGDKYEGGRDFESMKSWADENLGPSCGPKNLDLCSDEQKAEIEKYQAQDPAELKAKVDAATTAAEDAESTFKAEVEKLQKNYEKLSKAKDDAVAAAATPELRVIKMVLAAGAKDAKDEL